MYPPQLSPIKLTHELASQVYRPSAGGSMDLMIYMLLLSCGDDDGAIISVMQQP